MAKGITEWLVAHRVDVGSLVADEIVGIGHALIELRSIAGRLRHPEIVTAAGGELPRGLLLHGPPGIGKTTCARYLARLIGAEIPVYEIAADELTAPRVRAVFRALRGVRSILVLEDVDAVGLRTRFLEERAAAVQRALLVALDGLTAAAGPLVVATTTRGPSALEPALVRSGRIGVHIALDSPDQGERTALLAALARGRAVAPDVDWEAIARQTEGSTPADLRGLLDDALGLALAADRTEIGAADLETAVGRGGEIRKELEHASWWDARRAAIHEAGHVAVAVALLGADAISTVELSEPVGGETRIGPEDRPWQALPDDELRATLAVGYGGLAAEQAVLGTAAAGAQGDIAKLTRVLAGRLAAGLEATFPAVDLSELWAVSDELRTAHDAAVVREAEAARALAGRIVAANVAAIERFAAVLSERESLAGEALTTAIAEAGFHIEPRPVKGGRDAQ